MLTDTSNLDFIPNELREFRKNEINYTNRRTWAGEERIDT